MIRALHDQGYRMMPFPSEDEPVGIHGLVPAETSFDLLCRKADKDAAFKQQHQTFMSEISAHSDANIVPKEIFELTDVGCTSHFAAYHPRIP